MEHITQNFGNIVISVNAFVLIGLLVTIILFLIKRNQQLYKGFPFDTDELNKFHKLVEKKVVPEFKAKLKNELPSLNIRDISQKDYHLSDILTLRFTYLGEIFLVENSTNVEIYIGNLKKINNLNRLISIIKLKNADYNSIDSIMTNGFL